MLLGLATIAPPEDEPRGRGRGRHDHSGSEEEGAAGGRRGGGAGVRSHDQVDHGLYAAETTVTKETETSTIEESIRSCSIPW